MRKVALLLVIMSAALTALCQAGTLDPNYGSEGIVRSNLLLGRGPAAGRKTFVQPDGTLLVLLQEGSQVLTRRFLADGSYVIPDGDILYTSSSVYGDAAQDSAGRILVAATLDKDIIIRYLADAEHDEQYFYMGFPDSTIATAIAIQRDGKIVVAGYTFIQGIAHFAVARCYPDGRKDSTFGNDGRVVTANGNNGAYATCIALQNDSKIVVGGYAGGLNAKRDFAVVRYNSNGSRDLTFSDDGKQLTTVGADDDIANAIAIQPDGKILLSGRSESSRGRPGAYAIATVRYTTSGKLDATFNSTGIVITATSSNAEAVSILVQDNAKIVIAATPGFILLRYNPNGTLDPSTGNGDIQYIDFDKGPAWASSALLAAGKIFVTGWTDPPKGSLREVALVRYTADVMPDVNFSGDGKVTQYISTSSTGFNCTVVQPDGKLVVGGGATDMGDDFFEFTMLVLARYNPDGSLDTTFGTKGKVNTVLENFGNGATAMALQRDGKIIVGSSLYIDPDHFVLVRYKTNGVIDSTFGNNGITYVDFSDEIGEDSYDELTALTIQPDGKIIAVGNTQGSEGEGPDQMAIARCNVDGSLDASFDHNGKKIIQVIGMGSGSANAVATQGDNKIVVAGTTTSTVTQQRVFALIRLNTDGTLDPSFSRDGQLTTGFGPNSTNVGASSVAIQPDTKIIVGGTSNGNFTLVRYYANGNLDLSFSGDGKQETNFGGFDAIRAVLVQPDNKIIAAGNRGTGNGDQHFALARYNENGTLDSTFGIKGKQTTAIERTWNILGGIAMYGDRLYTAGTAQTDIGIGVIATYYLKNNTPLTKAVKVSEYNDAGNSLVVTAFPNPATQYFTIQISGCQTPIHLRITNAAGHVMDAFQELPANGSVQVGARYPPGVYFVELIQGSRKKSIKLVKSVQ